MLTAQPSSSIPGDNSGEGAHSSNTIQPSLISSQLSSTGYSDLGQRNPSQPTAVNVAEEVATRNNRILDRTCQQLDNFTTYGLAIDEFYQWCKDERAYHPLNEQAILKCLEIIKKRAPDWGMWSALRVFTVAMKYRDRLSSQFSAILAEWYSQLKGEGGSTPIAKFTTAHSNDQPLSPISAGDAAPIQLAPPQYTSSPQQIHHSQQQRHSSSYPSPPIASSNPQSYPSTSAISQLRQTNVPGRSKESVNNVNPLVFSQQYQQQLLQWQHLWFNMQQQKRTMPTTLPIPTPLNPLNRQSVSLNQPNRQSALPYLSIPHHQTSACNSSNNIGPSVSQILPMLNQPAVNVPGPRHSITASPTITASSETISNGYMRPLCRAIAPFQPQHDHPIANVNININGDIFQRLWMRTMFKLPPAQVDDKLLPISFVLNSWKAKGTESKCDWPEKVDLAVNGAAIVPLRKRKVQIPNKSQNMHMMVGKDRPLDLTSMLMPGANSITIKQNACACSYAFGITLYVRESEQLIRTRVMGRRKTIAQGQQLVNKLIGIKENIPKSPQAVSGQPSRSQCAVSESVESSVQSGEDDEIECMQDSIKVSLRCPISLLRIKEPVKGVNCSHVECFDLVSYLCINQGLSTWKCPVCSKYTTSASIIYDEYFAQLLKDMDDNITETEYSRTSRSWKPVSFATDDDDDDGSDGDEPPQPKVNSLQSLSVTDKRKSCQGLVNLISDDEGDDAEINASAKRPKTNSLMEQLIQNDRAIVSQQAGSIYTPYQPTTTAQLPSPIGSENNAFPFLQLPSLPMDNQPSKHNGNVPPTVISSAIRPSEILQGQESAHAPVHPSDLIEVSSSSVTATVPTTYMPYPNITAISTESEPMMTQSPFPSYPNHSSMSTPAIRNSSKSKAPCSIYLPKKKLSRS
ncbi:hypothetical protein K450DRAFT_236429 [Umbelopsis ramanniana AG]|uniref:SP-RING-type domain-containing protein n=1 Tax=Umbelopsis ramanniana AG TaxID=1314678 RepID=A0AAD5EB02_UMBRA|nr:uncharacterized protein K450DRAFT_236429 [Umbelopsis ramanniana AG]KAI8580611.1 hypothetical protein K450DRAFT_236429 [Umbelopsis ramanniana AG]